MAIDARVALRKLQSGQAMTDAEYEALGMTPPIKPSATAGSMTDAQLKAERDRESGVFQNYGTIEPGIATVSPTPKYDAAVKSAADRAAADAALKESTKPADFDNPPAGTRYVWQVGAGGGGKWVKVNTQASSGGGGGGGDGAGSGAGTSSSAGKVYTASDGKTFTDQQAYATYEANLQNTKVNAAATAAAEKANRESAYNTLLNEFTKYGLGSLVQDAKNILMDAKDPASASIALQNTDAYKQRFSANQDRIAKGLQALTPAQYIALEDQYQNVMRNYGLPSSYYSKDSMGTQAGFNKFIANDVSAAELEDRIATAQQRLINADPNVMNALKQFYPSISQGDVLAYTLDPTNALNDIKRKVTAAEIGGAALNQGLMTTQASAEDLAKYGITKAQAQAGYQSIGSFLPTATNLSQIYQGQGLAPYTQQTAEQEIFGTAGAAQAAQQRKKLSELEQAQFAAKSGTAQNALSRDRALSPYMLGTPGAGAF